MQGVGGGGGGLNDPSAFNLQTKTLTHIHVHTPSIAFPHLPSNSARFSYATEGAFFISAQLYTDAVSALRNVPVLTVEAT